MDKTASHPESCIYIYIFSNTGLVDVEKTPSMKTLPTETVQDLFCSFNLSCLILGGSSQLDPVVRDHPPFTNHPGRLDGKSPQPRLGDEHHHHGY